MKALESLLVEKGLVKPETLNSIIETYEHKVGPRNGAHVVAKAWTDPEFKQALMADATEVVARLGYCGRQGEHLEVVENTSDVHNLVVCTLCSCYPWTVLGLPPAWYKSAPYRSRAVSDPRAVLKEFGTELGEKSTHQNLGFHVRNALPGSAPAPGRNRELERTRSTATSEPQLHDRSGASTFSPTKR